MARRFIKLLYSNKAAAIGAFIISAVICAAIFAALDQVVFHSTLITRILHNPYSLDKTAKLSPPCSGHPLGTDDLGRDVLARIIYGAYVSIQVAVLAVAIAGVIGSFLGLIAGYYGGIVDMVIMRIVDILLAFPGILLALTFVAFVGPGLTNVVIALSLRSWVNYARIIRGEVLKLREEEFTLAAKAVGCSDWRLMCRHVLPNALAPVLVQATMGLGSMIISEASLSFLGLGVMPPTPSWGMMLSTGQRYIRTAWWLSVFPGLAIFLTVMGANLLGDAIRDMFDPRLLESTSKAEKTP